MRLFVGLKLPLPVRTCLGLTCGGLPGARWITPENLHMTLRFIGEVSGDRAYDIDHALSDITGPAFELALNGTGTFGRGRDVHTLWVGARPEPELIRLHERIESALVRAGLETERRKFTPHVTLARIKRTHPDRLARWLSEHPASTCPSFDVSAFTLFRSYLGHGGSHYEAVAEYPLAMSHPLGDLGEGFWEYEDLVPSY